jgi:hypothetical protein
LAQSRRPTYLKRQKEQKRLEKQRKKAEKRQQRKEERPRSSGLDDNSDIAHIIPGPQPPPEEFQ